eukprot:SAG31_NODE_11480_length_1025_cov_2.760259_1_plen_96_part_00
MDGDELSILYRDVVSLAENPACHIDTSQIISLSAAKVSEPACETDEVATTVCEQFIDMIGYETEIRIILNSNLNLGRTKFRSILNLVLESVARYV